MPKMINSVISFIKQGFDSFGSGSIKKRVNSVFKRFRSLAKEYPLEISLLIILLSIMWNTFEFCIFVFHSVFDLPAPRFFEF